MNRLDQSGTDGGGRAQGASLLRDGLFGTSLAPRDFAPAPPRCASDARSAGRGATLCDGGAPHAYTTPLAVEPGVLHTSGVKLVLVQPELAYDPQADNLGAVTRIVEPHADGLGPDRSVRAGASPSAIPSVRRVGCNAIAE